MNTKWKYFVFLVFGLGIGIIAGEIVEYWLPTEKEQALPISFRVLEKDGFVIGYDQRSKSASWVYEEITPAMLALVAKRPDGYFADPDLQPIFRAEVDDYSDSGYTRGHLAASADFSFSASARKGTNVLSNIVPQLERTNTVSMRKIEERIREDAKNSKVTRVVSGPIFEPENSELNIKVIGKSKVWVPTGFFKVWQVEPEDGDKQIHIIKLNHQKGAQPEEISLKDLESLTGVELQGVFDLKR